MSAQVIDFPQEDLSDIRDMGSPEWARQWQLTIQSRVQDLMTCQGNGGVPYSPMSTRSLLNLIKAGNDYQAWTSLTNKEGNRFKRFRDFCEYRRPWGLGVEYDRLSRYLKDNLGEKAVAILLEVNPDNTPGNSTRDEETGKFVPSNYSTGHELDKKQATDTEKRNKAIARAPEPVKQLYLQGLIGQKEAAKFGPYVGKNPKPEKQAKKDSATLAATELMEWVEKNPPPEMPLEKPLYMQEVNKEARRILGNAKMTLVFAKDESGGNIASKLYQKLSDEQLKQLLENLLNYFDKED